MERKLGDEEFMRLLHQLCEERALEIIRGDEHILYIPYIMNDAVEAYCILTDAVIPGNLPADLGQADAIDLTEGEQKKGMVIRKGEEIFASVWYGSCMYIQKFYQYHRIMHCWARGNEHMRMLVYMIGTVRDKLEYLGEEACNEKERSLIPLLEYRPFRAFSPINESIEDRYPETKEGYETMRSFAMHSGEEKLCRFMKRGRLLGRAYDQKISREMACSKRLFDSIYQTVCAASEVYEMRQYAEPAASGIETVRNETHKKIIQAGYAGEYPRYRIGGKILEVFEEHPFTVSIMDDMNFKVHLLEWDIDKQNNNWSINSIVELDKNT